MKAPRFNYERGSGAASRFNSQKHSKWIPVAHIGDPLLRATASRRRKIFAIVKPPISRDAGRKLIRRILIFDNHPDSIRLISGQRLKSEIGVELGRHRPTRHRTGLRRRTSRLAAARYIKPSHLVIGLVAMLALILGMVLRLL